MQTLHLAEVKFSEISVSSGPNVTESIFNNGRIMGCVVNTGSVLVAILTLVEVKLSERLVYPF